MWIEKYARRSLQQHLEPNTSILYRYEDFTIFESDYNSLSCSWLTDTAVNFAAAFVKNELFGESDDQVGKLFNGAAHQLFQVCIVYAFLCEMLKYTDVSSVDQIRELLSSVGVGSSKFCFFFVNDSTNPLIAGGGTHWTLLVHDPVRKALVQLGTFINSSPLTCRLVYRSHDRQSFFTLSSGSSRKTAEY